MKFTILIINLGLDWITIKIRTVENERKKMPDISSNIDDFNIYKQERRGEFAGAERILYKKKDERHDENKPWDKISRTNLIGQNNEPCAFHLRYFEIEPGGYSSFEKHEHIHTVICEHGVGLIFLMNKWFRLQQGDVVYIGSEIAHQLRCDSSAEEPFGFFCIVDAQRDKPILLGDISDIPEPEDIA